MGGAQFGYMYPGRTWHVLTLFPNPVVDSVRTGGHRLPMMLDRNRIPEVFTPGNAPNALRRSNAPEVWA